MLSHVFVGVSDFDRAPDFYRPLMAALGIRERFVDRGRPWAGWQPYPGPRPLFLIGTPFDGRPHGHGNGRMVALLAHSRSDVRRAHAIALDRGGSDEGSPGLRPQDRANDDGACFRDPDGNTLCVACHAAPDTDDDPRPAA